MGWEKEMCWENVGKDGEAERDVERNGGRKRGMERKVPGIQKVLTKYLLNE